MNSNKINKVYVIYKKLICVVSVVFLLFSFIDVNYAYASEDKTDTHIEQFDSLECDNDIVDNEIIIKFRKEMSEKEVKDYFSDERIKSVEDIYESVYNNVKNDENLVDKNVNQIRKKLGKIML